MVFITEKDIFKKNLPLYRVERIVLETGEPFNDGGHILYANASYVGDDPVGRLMADFRERDPEKMHFPSLAERVRHYKNTDGGMNSMSRIVEEIKEEGRAEGREETREQMVNGLLTIFPAEALLHEARFQILRITPEEIEAARMWTRREAGNGGGEAVV